MIHVKVTNKCGMVDVYFGVTGTWLDVYFGVTGTWPRVNAESNIPSPKAVLWGDMPVGMVGIDGDEHADAAMRICASYGDGRNAVDVE